MQKGEDVAKNFRVSTKKNGDKSLAFQLFGDFDASSACELINLLDESVAKSTKVAIDTDGLRNVNRFGLDVLLPRITRLNNTRVDIEVTGRFRGVFQDE